jgi:uncharacterized membrane protein YqgA involved in biofilm formation
MVSCHMTGTLLNAAGILLGGILGLTLSRQLSPRAQVGIKGFLGVLVVVVGLKAAVMNLGGGFWLVAKQLVIIVLALTFGRISGRLLHLQKGLNRLGRFANHKFSNAAQSSARSSQSWDEGFITCTILFCVGPMSILGAVQDGLDGHWQTLGVKALIDGLATMAFVGTFGWGAILSVVPVVAYQGSVTLGAKLAAPHLQDPAMMASLNATCGLLVFCIALIILELKKIELADYLPSLVFAPLLTWLWR